MSKAINESVLPMLLEPYSTAGQASSGTRRAVWGEFEGARFGQQTVSMAFDPQKEQQ